MNKKLDMGNWSGFDNLPKDILVHEIMFRLQPKSLMILKSLNKSWYFFIRCLSKDLDFVAKHQHHAEAHYSMLLINKPLLYHRRKLQALSMIKHGISKLVVPIVPRQKKKPSPVLASMFVTQFIDDRCVTENIYVSHLPDFLSRRRDTYTEVYHCNGVICLTNDLKNLTFYCPVTGDFETFYPKLGGEFQRYAERLSGMGFGSNSGATDFKVVRVLGSVGAQVFAPGMANSWRKIEFSVRDKDYRSLWGHLYLKGYCFWSAKSNAESVLCFDVRGEVFRDIPLPGELGESNAPSSIGIWIPTKSTLRACNDTLCLFWIPHEKSPSIDIWVMDIEKGLGFNCSWRKWLRIDRSEGFVFPLAFWRNDEILVKTIDRKIVLYNICTQKYKSLSIAEILGNQVLYFGHYVNSLASINWMMKHIRSNPSG